MLNKIGWDMKENCSSGLLNSKCGENKVCWKWHDDDEDDDDDDEKVFTSTFPLYNTLKDEQISPESLYF